MRLMKLVTVTVRVVKVKEGKDEGEAGDERGEGDEAHQSPSTA